MPSPFPGMNPYLERSIAWHDFHERFLILGAGVIGAQVQPRFIVKIDEHVYVREAPGDVWHLAGRADLGLTPTPAQTDAGNEVAVAEAPVRVRVPAVDIERESFLEIRDRASMEIVTALELLSPSNKRPGADREQYLAKRRHVLASHAHLVEIDLLRGGEPMPTEGVRPDCAYSVLVSRVEDRPEAEFWPIALREPLPTIPIPLRDDHPDAHLDLQALLHRVYDEAGYAFYIYDGPPEPPLSPDEEAWTRTRLPTAE